jgi:hypothetical protein
MHRTKKDLAPEADVPATENDGTAANIESTSRLPEVVGWAMDKEPSAG